MNTKTKIYKSIKCPECGDKRLKNVTIPEDYPNKVYECTHCGCEFIKGFSKSGFWDSVNAWTSGQVFQK